MSITPTQPSTLECLKPISVLPTALRCDASLRGIINTKLQEAEKALIRKQVSLAEVAQIAQATLGFSALLFSKSHSIYLTRQPFDAGTAPCCFMELFLVTRSLAQIPQGKLYGQVKSALEASRISFSKLVGGAIYVPIPTC